MLPGHCMRNEACQAMVLALHCLLMRALQIVWTHEIAQEHPRGVSSGTLATSQLAARGSSLLEGLALYKVWF